MKNIQCIITLSHNNQDIMITVIFYKRVPYLHSQRRGLAVVDIIYGTELNGEIDRIYMKLINETISSIMQVIQFVEYT